MILAAQSDFFDGLFSFPSESGGKEMEYNITTPNIHPYLTAENFKLVLDTFYEIEPDFDEDKALEMATLGNYFLAPNLTKKAMDILISQIDAYGDEDDEERVKILNFAERFHLFELKKLALNW